MHVEVAQPDAVPAQLVLHDLPHPRAVLHHDQPLRPQLVEGDAATGEVVPRRTREDHLVAQERIEPHAAVTPRGADDAELELAVGDELDHGLRVVDLEGNADGGVEGLELAQEQGNRDRRGARGRADRELPTELAVPLGGDLLDELFLELEQALCTPVQAPPSLGRLDPAAGTVEELCAETLLERPHLKRHGGLRDTEALRRLREAAPLHDGTERCQLARVHKRTLSNSREQSKYTNPYWTYGYMAPKQLRQVYNTSEYMEPTSNPFAFGALALDDAFVDREEELAALLADLRSGQDVVLLAPRRYGKSSLALRAVQVAAGEGTLVAYCDLMRTPTKQRFAAGLAKTILDDLASPTGQLVERAAALVRGLRVRPTIEIDPDHGGVSFSFEAARAPTDIDETIERLLELPGRIGAERRRRVALVLDEFQEVVKLDDRLPNLMRAVFQTQPEVGHVYLGSKRHVLEAIFSDRNEPFWRSAKRMELGRISTEAFASYLHDRFATSERDADEEAIARLLEITDGHPYATQELAYLTWGRVPQGFPTHRSDVEAALADVLRAEHNNLSRVWDGATRNERLVLLALQPGPAALYAEETRLRFGLPPATYVQRAMKALAREDVVEKGADGRYRLAEPFLAEWIAREQHGSTDHVARRVAEA